MQPLAVPMDLPDIIAATWSTYLRHRRVLWSIALVGATVSGAANYGLLRVTPSAVAGEEITSEQVRASLRAGAPWVAVGLAGTLLTHLSLVHAGLRLLRGRPARPAAALGAGARALPSAVIAGLIAFMLCVSLLAALVFAPLALYLFVGWLLVPEVIVDEGRGPFAALGRSRRLVRGQWWRTGGVGLSVLVLYAFPGIIMAAIGGNTNSEVGASLAAGIATLVASPFLALGHTQLYLDIRLRKGEPLLPARPPEHAPL